MSSKRRLIILVGSMLFTSNVATAGTDSSCSTSNRSVASQTENINGALKAAMRYAKMDQRLGGKGKAFNAGIQGGVDDRHQNLTEEERVLAKRNAKITCVKAGDPSKLLVGMGHIIKDTDTGEEYISTNEHLYSPCLSGKVVATFKDDRGMGYSYELKVTHLNAQADIAMFQVKVKDTYYNSLGSTELLDPGKYDIVKRDETESILLTREGPEGEGVYVQRLVGGIHDKPGARAAFYHDFDTIKGDSGAPNLVKLNGKFFYSGNHGGIANGSTQNSFVNALGVKYILDNFKVASSETVSM